MMPVIYTLAFIYAWYTELNKVVHGFLNKGNLLIIFMYFVIVYATLKMWNAFCIGMQKLVNVVVSQAMGVLFGNIITYMELSLISGTIYTMVDIFKTMAIMTIVQWVGSLVFPYILNLIYIGLFPPHNILQINGDRENNLADKIRSREDRYRICEEVSVHEPWEELEKKMLHYRAVLLNDLHTEDQVKIVKYCYAHSIRLYFTPKITDIIIKGSDTINYFDSPIFVNRNIGLTIEQRVVKRTLDIIIALIALILTSPILLVTAISIKAYDGGPVFYRQERTTFRGKKFWIIKFRSMIENAEADGKSHPATDDDDRITPVGRFIRKTRIDELPQFINILKGDMSVVGPRPERVEHMEKYAEDIPEFDYRLKVKGGLTGYAQVYGKYNTTPLDKLKMDLMYIVNYSLLLDIQIFFETVKVIFRKEATEGFSEEQTEKIADEKPSDSDVE
ncbi:MAG: exopolysaccharide biosynthesis polyprenyl glycosylphosphotransferase [Lachnospiraceae bacterium]|nr:exopolysaccharide biosynthesis polyprenyl glycosylphosphotransferase [Lachnospiraceae bacterium]